MLYLEITGDSLIETPKYWQNFCHHVNKLCNNSNSSDRNTFEILMNRELMKFRAFQVFDYDNFDDGEPAFIGLEFESPEYADFFILTYSD